MSNMQTSNKLNSNPLETMCNCGKHMHHELKVNQSKDGVMKTVRCVDCDELLGSYIEGLKVGKTKIFYMLKVLKEQPKYSSISDKSLVTLANVVENINETNNNDLIELLDDYISKLPSIIVQVKPFEDKYGGSFQESSLSFNLEDDDYSIENMTKQVKKCIDGIKSFSDNVEIISAGIYTPIKLDVKKHGGNENE